MLIPASEVGWIEKHFPNTASVHVGEGLHFIQEDQPHAIGRALAEWYQQL